MIPCPHPSRLPVASLRGRTASANPPAPASCVLASSGFEGCVNKLGRGAVSSANCRKPVCTPPSQWPGRYMRRLAQSRRPVAPWVWRGNVAVFMPASFEMRGATEPASDVRRKVAAPQRAAQDRRLPPVEALFKRPYIARTMRFVASVAPRVGIAYRMLLRRVWLIAVTATNHSHPSLTSSNRI